VPRSTRLVNKGVERLKSFLDFVEVGDWQ